MVFSEIQKPSSGHTYLEVQAIFSVIPSWEQLWHWCSSCIVPSFRITETFFNGPRTRKYFGVVAFVLAISCLVFEPHKPFPSGLVPGYLSEFRPFLVPRNTHPSLRHFCVTLLDLQGNTNYPRFQFFYINEFVMPENKLSGVRRKHLPLTQIPAYLPKVALFTRKTVSSLSKGSFTGASLATQ